MVRVAAALLATLLIVTLANAAAFAQAPQEPPVEPPPVSPRLREAPQIDRGFMWWLDPREWWKAGIEEIKRRIREGSEQHIRQYMAGFRDVLLTPDFAHDWRVQQLWNETRLISAALLLLLVLIGAGMAAFSLGDFEVKEAVGRLLLAGALIHFSLRLAGIGIDLSNTASKAFLGASPELGDLAFNRAAVYQVSEVILPLVLFLVNFALFLLNLLRLVLLMVLLVGGPLILVGHALPHTSGWADAWGRGVLILLLVPVAQAFTIWAGAFVFFTGPDAILASKSGLVDAVLLVVLFVLMLVLPLWGAWKTFAGGKRWALRGASWLRTRFA